MEVDWAHDERQNSRTTFDVTSSREAKTVKTKTNKQQQQQKHGGDLKAERFTSICCDAETKVTEPRIQKCLGILCLWLMLQRKGCEH